MDRRLAAILAADVVGYSRLMEADEAGTVARLNSILREVVRPGIDGRGGRIVKLMGDGVLAEFPSVVEAVNCAIDLQSRIAEREGLLPEAKRIALRIGVNLGDIIHDGTDIFGDGVNVASRLEALARPGGICVSGTVFEHVHGKLSLEFQDMGEQHVKNIERAVRVFSIGPGGESAGARTAGGPSRAPRVQDKPSIAVLPFENMSGDREQEYFSDGITEDLITELSRFKGLSVVSRNSSFVFKGRPAPLREIGEKLGAKYIVEGSVRKVAGRIRITAQLIDAESDGHVWAERYDRDLAEIFEVQDDVVRRVASTLVDRLEYDGQRRLKRQSRDQLKAYDLYLRAREHFFNWSVEDNRKAGEYLRSAIALERDHAAALALLSEVLLREWLNGWSEQPDRDLAECLALAQQADELDPLDSRTQTALAMACLFHRRPDRAKSHFEAALRINPNDTRVLVYYSRHAVFVGDTDKAIALCEQARSLNPYGKYDWPIALALFVARQYEEAIRYMEEIRNHAESVLALLAGS